MDMRWKHHFLFKVPICTTSTHIYLLDELDGPRGNLDHGPRQNENRLVEILWPHDQCSPGIIHNSLNVRLISSCVGTYMIVLLCRSTKYAMMLCWLWPAGGVLYSSLLLWSLFVETMILYFYTSAYRFSFTQFSTVGLADLWWCS